jgi:hypothetical protein
MPIQQQQLTQQHGQRRFGDVRQVRLDGRPLAGVPGGLEAVADGIDLAPVVQRQRLGRLAHAVVSVRRMPCSPKAAAAGTVAVWPGPLFFCPIRPSSRDEQGSRQAL